MAGQRGRRGYRLLAALNRGEILPCAISPGLRFPWLAAPHRASVD
jgi:hypothetical protein